MEHFTRSIKDDNEETNFLSHDSCSSNNLDPKSASNDVDDIDIEALLNRPRYGYRRTKAFEQAPEFTKRLEPFNEVEAGSSLIFVCQYKAFPKPTIKWYRDDEEVTPDHPYYRAEEDRDAGTACLVIPEVMGSDEGAFKCKAENQEGVASTTGYLSVTGDVSSKTLSAQQKKSTNSPTSPCVSSAPHLMTILEQKSMEEREGELQRKMPPSPLQNYIEIVQKTKTWPMAKMGYNPEDFLPKQSVSLDDDAQSTGSDTSVESQQSNHVSIKYPENMNDQIVQNGIGGEDPHTPNLNLLHPDDANDNDSVHSYDSRDSRDSAEMDDDEDENHKPVCTVSVQIRSCDTVSRLTKIRQDERLRLSVTLSEETDNSDISDNLSDVDYDEKPEHTEEKVLAEIAPVVENGIVSGNFNEDNENSRQRSIEQDTLVEEEISPQQFSNQESNMKEHNPIDISKANASDINLLKQSQEDLDSVEELDNLYKSKITKLPQITNKKSLIHQSSRERKAKLKKQKSLVEMSLGWLFKKLTGKVGEQLDLPWIYYFAFTVLCACFAAAIRLNPFYMILIVAVLSFISFRFLPCEEYVLQEEEVTNDINEESSSC